MSWNNPIPVAVCLVPVVDRGRRYLLGMIRATAPGLDGLAYPGGYTEEMEDAPVSASRELKEETTLELPPEVWRPRYTRITPNNRLLIYLVSTVEITGDVVRALPPTREASGYRLIQADTDLVFPLHQQVNVEYFSELRSSALAA
jgi:ADP-ribose pyrophosphatase YjhB (NUDIX family)